MVNNEDSTDLLDSGVEKRLEAFATSKVFASWHKIITETIQSWYPNLSVDELIFCESAFCTMWDLDSGNSALYIELLERLVQTNILGGETAIDNMMRSLVAKSVVKAREEIWSFGGKEKSLTVLNFVQKDLYKELLSASNENFERVTNAYFYPRRKLN
ncbi:MAG TPA: hypothetical protein VFB48_00510 [Nitrososphaeraceae archaeon]|nr:hypothetical protein [Nitrososphaeraceae archaeon]